MHVYVIGAGVTGITTAYFLTKQGFKVTVLEKEKSPSSQTSRANGCQLSVSNAETWNSWRTLGKGVKWLFDPQAPLVVNWTPNYKKYKWLFDFVRNIPNYEKNTIKTVQMALDSQDAYEEILREEDISYDRMNKGILHIYRSEKEFENAKRVNEIYSKAGLERQQLDWQGVVDVENQINPEGIIGGFYTPTDYTGDIYKFTTQLANVLKNKYGVEFLYDTEYKMHDPGYIWTKRGVGYKYDAVVICMGVYSGLGIYPIKGYSVTINLDPQSAITSPEVSLLDDEHKIVTARLGVDRLRIAGTAEIGSFNKDIREDRIQPLLYWVQNNFPTVDTSDYIPWAGLRPMTPSMMPIVKRDRNKPKTFYNTGHGHLGWTLGAGTARSCARQVLMAHNSLQKY